ADDRVEELEAAIAETELERSRSLRDERSVDDIPRNGVDAATELDRLLVEVRPRVATVPSRRDRRAAGVAGIRATAGSNSSGGDERPFGCAVVAAPVVACHLDEEGEEAGGDVPRESGGERIVSQGEATKELRRPRERVVDAAVVVGDLLVGV